MRVQDAPVDVRVGRVIVNTIRHKIFGVLDGNGDATAAFNVPPGLDPDLVGLTLFHAYAASPTLGDADYASNALPFTLTL